MHFPDRDSPVEETQGFSIYLIENYFNSNRHTRQGHGTRENYNGRSRGEEISENIQNNTRQGHGTRESYNDWSHGAEISENNENNTYLYDGRGWSRYGHVTRGNYNNRSRDNHDHRPVESRRHFLPGQNDQIRSPEPCSLSTEMIEIVKPPEYSEIDFSDHKQPPSYKEATKH